MDGRSGVNPSICKAEDQFDVRGETPEQFGVLLGLEVLAVEEVFGRCVIGALGRASFLAINNFGRLSTSTSDRSSFSLERIFENLHKSGRSEDRYLGSQSYDPI